MSAPLAAKFKWLSWCSNTSGSPRGQTQVAPPSGQTQEAHSSDQTLGPLVVKLIDQSEIRKILNMDCYGCSQWILIVLIVWCKQR